VQSAVVKFKMTPTEKARLINAAENADTSMSALLRRMAMIAVAGRPLDRNARLEIAAMRAAANALKAAIDNLGAEPTEVTDRLRQAACELHRIAVRQLDIRR
jgi:transposase-like protein